MKSLFLTLAAALTAAGAWASEAPLWLRNTAISPDGTRIAFTYKGDIYTVPAAGGTAVRLTADPAYDTNPAWSPDGTRIAFNSNRLGSNDVYVMPATGGTPKRITTHSGNEVVRCWSGDSAIVFSADILPSEADLTAPFFLQTYIVDAKPGSRPRLYLSLDTRSASINSRGDMLFEDRKSYENAWRKHELSSGTGDIHLHRADGSFERLTTFGGNDRNPVWLGSDGSHMAWLSEEDGTLNIYTAALDGSGKRKLTDYDRHPVRSLSASADGKLLAYSYNGEIYTLTPGGQPRKVAVDIVTDDFDADHIKRYVNGGADNMAVSPDGEEVAFTLRGDVYVTSVKYKTTRRITDTPAQERNISFAPDGRTLVYDSERDGIWQLFTAKIKDDKEKSFAYATDIVEEPLYKSDLTAQQPEFSPDGKKVAFLENRTELRVIDLDSKEVTTALDGKYNYSYADGDISYRWSPDSRWFIIDYIGTGGWNNSDIALVAADGSQVFDLTESGYSDGAPQWALDGKAITYATGRYGMKSHGSWGNETDVMLMVLDPEAWDKFNLTEEEAELAEKAEEEAEKSDKSDSSDKSDKNKKKKKSKKKAKADKKDEKPDASVFDLANRRYRMRRLTGSSSRMHGYYLSPKGDKLYYIAPAPDGSYNLYGRDLRKGDTEIVAAGKRGGFIPDKKGENVFMFSNGSMCKVNLSSGKTETIEFEAPYDRHPSLEREYIYGHAWQQVKDKFYDENLHGVDWAGYGEDYRRFLPHIDNNVDFSIMLSELLGELNASHTGASAYSGGASLQTATLGAFYDEAYTGDGLKISGIMPRGPLAAKKAGVKVGDIIMAIDGEPIEAGKDYYTLLEGKAGKKTRLSIRRPDGTDTLTTVKPISAGAEGGIRYAMWVERNEAVVDSLSDGRVGYVHIQGMDGSSFSTVYDRLLGKFRNCDAVVVDTRFNGGGWLHNDVALLLSGREYVRYAPRGRYIGSDPFSQWTKPSVMLVNEANYSDAHGTPYTYKTLGIGKLVGAPVPGTMTAVWWESQIDPSIVFGIPQVTSLDRNGKALENQQLMPDIEVYNTPADIVSGNDRQLRAAVEALLKK
ncbi:MAG: S41 family peptidase [Muribaculaceae bacterium]|nr:S41 family peptidase [Muribaculaceae bacterium]